MERIKFAVGLGLVLAFVIAPCAKAAEITMMIESGIHHLGDETAYGGLFHLAPYPEGTSWQSSSVDLPVYPITAARILIDTVEVQLPGTSVLVNGTSIGSIPLSLPITDWTADQSLSFDPALLRSTGNTIAVQSGYEPGNYDELLFTNLRLAIVPEPTTLVSLAIGSLVAAWRRRA